MFAFLTLGLAANQVASGLALTILGLGLSGVDRRVLRRRPHREAMPQLYLPGLTDIPVRRAASSSAQDPFVYLSHRARRRRLVVPHAHARRARAARLGENHASAHALGYPVLTIRLARDHVRRRMRRARGRLPVACLHAVLVAGHDGGARLDRACLVVFASWLPWRLLVGAYLFGGVTILQLHAQGMGIGIPSQLLSALPYVATIIALVVISTRRGGGRGGPASLGIPFVPDR